MKLSHMEYFLTVCRCGSVTQAAKELHISQPSISIAIREMETQFGVNLFYRRNKRLILTKEGEFFREKVADILARVRLLDDQMKDMGNLNNHIRIGVSPMISIFLYEPLRQAFRSQYFDIQLELCEYGSLESQRLLMEDNLDIAISILDERTAHHFHILNLLETRLVFCVRRGHHLAARTKVTIEDLRDEELILMKSTSYQTGALIMERFDSAGIKPNVVLHSSQLYIMKKYIVEHGAGAFFMEPMARLEPELIGIPIDPQINVRIGLIWKKGGHLYSGVSRFIDFARSYDD